jgi:acyl-CoA thioesterase FadM
LKNLSSDARGQTSDTSLARYAEQSRGQFLTQTVGAGRLASPTGFIVGHGATRWLVRGRPPAAWQVGCVVTRIGERSMAVRSALFDSEQCHAVCDTVMVVIDRDSRRSTTLPVAARDLLEPYRQS